MKKKTHKPITVTRAFCASRSSLLSLVSLPLARSLLSLFALSLSCAAQADTSATATTPEFRLSVKHDGVRASAGEETLRYSTLWDGDTNATSTVTLAQNGTTLVENLTGEGDRSWSVTRNGTYNLTHTTYTNGAVAAVLNATFTVTGKDVPFPEGSVKVTGWSGKYDGQPHSISVTTTGIETPTITYALDAAGPFGATNPTFTTVTNQTVWCVITAEGYITETNSASVVITEGEIGGGGGGEEPGPGEVPEGGLSKFDATYVYDGEGHTINTQALYAVTLAGATPSFSFSLASNGVYQAAPFVYTNVGEYVCWYKIEAPNYKPFVHQAKLTIKVPVHEHDVILFDKMLTKDFHGGNIEPGNYFFADDVDITESIVCSNGPVRICLNGKVLNGHGKDITGILSFAELFVCDCGDTVHYFDTSDYPWVITNEVSASNVYPVAGGVLTGFAGGDGMYAYHLQGGCAIASVKDAMFEMKRGCIVGCGKEGYCLVGGGICARNLKVDGVKLFGNRAEIGAAIYQDWSESCTSIYDQSLNTSSGTVINCEISNNRGIGPCGILTFYGKGTLSNTTLTNNLGRDVVYALEDLSITGCQIADNRWYYDYGTYAAVNAGGGLKIFEDPFINGYIQLGADTLIDMSGNGGGINVCHVMPYSDKKPTTGHPTAVTTQSDEDWSSRIVPFDQNYTSVNVGSGDSQVVYFSYAPDGELGDGEIPEGNLSKYDTTQYYDGMGHTINTQALYAVSISENTPSYEFASAEDGPWQSTPMAFTNVGQYVVWYKISDPVFPAVKHAARVTILTPACEIKNMVATQRYPWNGKVDVDFMLESIDPAATYRLVFSAEDANGGTNLLMKSLSMDPQKTNMSMVVVAPGSHRLTWDADADIGAVKIDDVSIKVVVKHPLDGVQLWADGPYWAECNVGASQPEEGGYRFWWGDTIGYVCEGGTWSGSTCSDVIWISSAGVRQDESPFSSWSCPTRGKDLSALQAEGYVDATGNLVAEHDAASVHAGVPWRMPTDEEVADISSKCNTIWTMHNGKYGRLVTGKGAYASKSIFIPAAGEGAGSLLQEYNSRGHCWASTPKTYSIESTTLSFTQHYFLGSSWDRYRGLPVRPIRAFGSGEPVVYTVASTRVSIDSRVGTRASGGNETLRYSSRWHGGTNETATVTIGENDGTLVDNLMGEGCYNWCVGKPGLFTLTHTTYTNSAVAKTLTAQFLVSGVPVPPSEVMVTPYEAAYDGKPHGISVAGPDGTTVKYCATSNGIYDVNVAFSNVCTTSVWYEVSGEGYIPYTNSASVVITNRPVTLTSASDSKKYDGTALTNSHIIISELGWADGEGATYNVTGSQTAAGSSANTFGYTLNEGTKESNYLITKVEGTLTVTEGDIGGGGGEEPGTGEVPEGGLSKFDATYVYDGEGHTINTQALYAVTLMDSTPSFSFAADVGGLPGGQPLPADDAAWQTEAPAYTNAGKYVVWYRITAPNYSNYIHSARVTITNKPVRVVSAVAHQRYPWNGLVDIDITFDGEPGDLAQVECTFAATNGATKTALPITYVSRSGVDTGTDRAWKRRYVWNAAADVGEGEIDGVVVAVGAKVIGGGVQLWENGPYWAECNVGADSPGDAGYYFWWGDTVGYKREGGTWYTHTGDLGTYQCYKNVTWVAKDGVRVSNSPFVASECPTFRKDNSELYALGYCDPSGILVPFHDAAKVHFGEPWRLPTDAEWSDLLSNCTVETTVSYGVAGWLVTGKGVFATKSIFLPIVGSGIEFRLENPRTTGYYWSSTSNSNPTGNPEYDFYSAWATGYYWGSFARTGQDRYVGSSVRALRKCVGGEGQMAVIEPNVVATPQFNLKRAVEMLRKLTQRSQSSQRITKEEDSDKYLISLMFQNSSPAG